MEIVIKQLTEIESAAVSVYEDTQTQKRALADSTREKKDRFDKQTEEETHKEILKFTDELAKDSAQKLKSIEAQTAATLSSMDELYKKYHEQIAATLFQSIVGA